MFLWILVKRRVRYKEQGLCFNGWDTKVATRVAFRSPWKFISSCLQEFHKHVRFKVGDGLRIRFWEDIWVGNSTLVDWFPLLYRVAGSKNKSISSIRNSNFFIRLGGFLKNLNERELEQVSNLINLLDSVYLRPSRVDKRVWHLDNSGLYSYKSMFKKLISNSLDLQASSFSFVWKSYCPMKVKVFTLLISLNKANT